MISKTVKEENCCFIALSNSWHALLSVVSAIVGQISVNIQEMVEHKTINKVVVFREHKSQLCQIQVPKKLILRRT